jgi:hypothetical protein
MWGFANTASIVGRESCDRAALGTRRRRASRGCLCPVGEALVPRNGADIVTPPHDEESRGWLGPRSCVPRASSRLAAASYVAPQRHSGSLGRSSADNWSAHQARRLNGGYRSVISRNA